MSNTARLYDDMTTRISPMHSETPTDRDEAETSRASDPREPYGKHSTGAIAPLAGMQGRERASSESLT